MNLVEIVPAKNDSIVSQCKQQLMPFIYNRVISRYFYWILEALPFIELGKTEFKVLNEVSTLNINKLKLLSSNIARYQQTDKTPQTQLSEMPNNKLAIHLAKLCPTYTNQRLLRYPVLLANKQKRDEVLNELVNAGCGASPLYKTELTQIDGVSAKIKTTSDLANAKDFADRLITLPTHAGVTAKHCALIKQILNQDD
jgi:dTDP-4-amino-4,6-dideoxygalactose transaminase